MSVSAKFEASLSNFSEDEDSQPNVEVVQQPSTSSGKTERPDLAPPKFRVFGLSEPDLSSDEENLPSSSRRSPQYFSADSDDSFDFQDDETEDRLASAEENGQDDGNAETNAVGETGGEQGETEQTGAEPETEIDGGTEGDEETETGDQRGTEGDEETETGDQQQPIDCVSAKKKKGQKKHLAQEPFVLRVSPRKNKGQRPAYLADYYLDW